MAGGVSRGLGTHKARKVIGLDLNPHLFALLSYKSTVGKTENEVNTEEGGRWLTPRAVQT